MVPAIKLPCCPANQPQTQTIHGIQVHMTRQDVACTQMIWLLAHRCDRVVPLLTHKPTVHLVVFGEVEAHGGFLYKLGLGSY